MLTLLDILKNMRPCIVVVVIKNQNITCKELYMDFQKIVVGLLLLIIKHLMVDKLGLSQYQEEDMIPYDVVNEAIKFVGTQTHQRF
jgi:phage-related holin